MATARDLFKNLDILADGTIDIHKLQLHAQVLDKFQWNDAHLDKLFKSMKLDKDGRAPVSNFEGWVLEDALPDEKAFVTTFMERELTSNDIGTRVDLLIEFPSSPGAQAAWSPLKARTCHSGEIKGHGQGGGILVKVDEPDSRLLTVKQGQMRRTQFKEPTSPKSPCSPKGGRGKDRRWE